MGTCSLRLISATAICAGSCPLVLRLRRLVPTWTLPVPHGLRRLAWRLARAVAGPLVLPGACRPPRSPPAGIPGAPPALVPVLPLLPATATGTSAGSRPSKRPATTGTVDAGLLRGPPVVLPGPRLAASCRLVAPAAQGALPLPAAVATRATLPLPRGSRPPPRPRLHLAQVCS